MILAFDCRPSLQPLMIGLDTSGVKSGWQIWTPRPALGKVYAGRGVGDPALSRNLSININGSSRIPSLEGLVSRSVLHDERGKMAQSYERGPYLSLGVSSKRAAFTQYFVVTRRGLRLLYPSRFQRQPWSSLDSRYHLFADRRSSIVTFQAV